MKRPSLEKQLDEFLARKSWPHNGWIGDRYFKVYMRKGMHLIDGDIKSTLDIGSVETHRKHRKQGLWTRFITMAEAKAMSANIQYVYVENVINPILEASLKKRGYVPTGTGSLVKYFASASEAPSKESSERSNESVDLIRAA